MTDEKKLKSVTNTTDEVRFNPLDFLIRSAIEGGSSAAIERQEAQGQKELVNSATLPTTMRGRAKEVLEQAGVKFLGPVEGDPLFQYVELPAGWKKVPTDHSMASKLVDERGRVRASIFYKAAFYDRKADVSVVTRYKIANDYESEDTKHVVISQIKDGDKVIYSTEPIPFTTVKSRLAAQDEAYTRCKKVLDEQFPDWQNPAAYWN